MDDSKTDMMAKAAAALGEAMAAANAAVLAEPDDRKVKTWLSLAQLALGRVRRARQETWRRLALEEVLRYSDTIKHLIALRAAGEVE